MKRAQARRATLGGRRPPCVASRNLVFGHCEILPSNVGSFRLVKYINELSLLLPSNAYNYCYWNLSAEAVIDTPLNWMWWLLAFSANLSPRYEDLELLWFQSLHPLLARSNAEDPPIPSFPHLARADDVMLRLPRQLWESIKGGDSLHHLP